LGVATNLEPMTILPVDLRVRLLEVVEEARRIARTSDPMSGEQLLAQLIERYPFTAALVANTEGRYVAANRAASELTGYGQQELLTLSVWDLTPPAGERDVDVLWRAFLQQREQSGVYTLVTRYGRTVEARYAARAHVLPGLHLSLLKRSSE
jgi:PAS domain S-box-containing protein